MQNNPWIFTSDRLPDIVNSYPDCSDPVLIRTDDGRKVVGYLLKDSEYGDAWVECGRDGYHISGVVAWMPLP